MHSKMTKPIAAAIIIIAGFFSLTLFDKTVSKTYAMSDVPNLFHSAKTLHVKGKMFLPGHKDIEPAEIEYWIDVENSRWNTNAVGYSINENGVVVYETQAIFDGNHTQLLIDHKEKTYTYFTLSEFQKNLQIYQTINTLLKLICGQPEIFDSYRLKQQEVINAQIYNLWEGIVDLGQGKMKMQSWLSPNKGQLAKAIFWLANNDGKWEKQCEFETIEMNIPIDNSVFELKGPTDYTASNTIETAIATNHQGKLVGGLCDVNLEEYFLFSLPRNCLIMCWRNEFVKKPEIESSYFDDLYFGGPVPQLPAELYALKTQINGQDYHWYGKHLIYTQIDGKYYEWALYMPEKSPPSKPGHIYTYKLVYKMNIDQRASVTLATTPDMNIENQMSFENLVTAAIKATSDDDEFQVPFTLEEVLSLTQDDD